MTKKQKQPRILVDIYNLLIDIRNILVKVHKREICPHRDVSDKIEYWTTYTGKEYNGKEYTIHKCLTCGQLIRIPKKIQKKEV